MKSFRNLADFPSGRPLSGDQVLELHAARLLLLILLCGGKGGLKGLTKLAKLDFFVRYPSFFARVVGRDALVAEVESPMVRYHYGPWDKRYYQVLGYLEARDLISVRKPKQTYEFALTEKGRALADELVELGELTSLTEQMRSVKSAFGKRSGSALKALIYDEFSREIAERPIGETISE